MGWVLRDRSGDILPVLVDGPLGGGRGTIKQNYAARGRALGACGEIPPFAAFYDLLKAEAKPDRGLMTRLAELADYGLFEATVGAPSLLDSATPALVQITVRRTKFCNGRFPPSCCITSISRCSGAVRRTVSPMP